MPKVTIVQVVYNHKQFIEPVFSAIFGQTFSDFHVVAVISGNDDGGKELLMEKFPQVEIIDPGFNIGFAAGHNLVFEKFDSEFFQLVNPDLILEPDYVEKLLKAFDDPKVGAVTGKLYQVERGVISNFKFPNFVKIFQTNFQHDHILDTTGVTISKSGRARDRGQHEVDSGQYDALANVQAVSGAGPMLRREALQLTRLPKLQDPNDKIQINSKLQITNFKSDQEYFDEDFHSYWEDVDLSWRMSNAGWKNVFVPEAVGYHGRGVGSSEQGYINVFAYIKYHKTISPRIRQLNYQNHLFMYLKNSKWLYPQFFIREFFMLGYILLFEWSTLSVVPKMMRLLPKMWRKRSLILSEQKKIFANKKPIV